MSNKKITDLTEYTSSQVKPYDLLFITDIDQQETKKIKSLELGNYIHSISSSKYRTGSFTGSFIGIATTASHLLYPNKSTASNAMTASYIKNAFSSSYALTASYSLNTGEDFQLTAFEETISQIGHGLSIGDAIYKNDNSFYKATAYTGSEYAPTTEVVGIVKNVINTDSFIICYGGIVDFDVSPPSYFNSVLNGTALFLTGSAGKLVSYDPSISDATQISKPVILKLDNSRGLLFNQRGVYEDDAEQYTIESASYAFNSTTSSYAITASYALFALNGGNNTGGPGGSTNNYYIDNNPIGTVIAMAVTSAPRNYLLCNGAKVRVRDYQKLADAIYQNPSPTGLSNVLVGNRFVYTPSTNTYRLATLNDAITENLYFQLPDLRGEFIRGWDNGRGIDNNRLFGSSQSGSIGSHYHGIGRFSGGSNDDGWFIYRNFADGNTYRHRYIPGDVGDNEQANFSYVTTSSYGMTTSDISYAPTASIAGFPKNIALNYYIKYDNDAYSGPVPDNIGISGDVNGNLLSTKVTKLQGIPISTNTPTVGDFLQYNGNSWGGSAASFLSSKTTNGYLDLPGGLTMQWGSGSVGFTTEGVQTITFSKEFTNQCLMVVCGTVFPKNDAYGNAWIQLVSYNKTNFIVRLQSEASYAGSGRPIFCNYWAIGF